MMALKGSKLAIVHNMQQLTGYLRSSEAGLRVECFTNIEQWQARSALRSCQK
jgi:hypothetical protein